MAKIILTSERYRAVAVDDKTTVLEYNEGLDAMGNERWSPILTAAQLPIPSVISLITAALVRP